MGLRVVMDADLMRRRAAQAGYWLCMGSGGLEGETGTLIANMTTKPTSARTVLINNLIVSLKIAGVWSKLGVLYVFAAADSQASLLNWKSPGGVAAVATNSPVFTADRGWVGDGVAAYLDTQIAWSAVSGTAQDNTHIGVYAAFGGTNAQAIAGAVGTSNVRIGRGSASLSTNLNSAVIVTADSVPASAGTHLCASRSQGAQFDRYVDGAAVSVGAQASVSPTATNFCGLRAGASFSPATASLRAMHAGPNLSATEVLALRNAVQTYMAAVGAN